MHRFVKYTYIFDTKLFLLKLVISDINLLLFLHFKIKY